MTGTIINTGAIVVGSLLGLILKNQIPGRINERIMQGIGLFTLVLGLKMVQGSEEIFLILVSLVLGGAAGELMQLEERLDALGQSLEKRFGRSQDLFTKGFVTTSLLFCVGPMAILGAIEDGLTGSYPLLLTKSIMDGVSSLAFASTFGIGVLFSAFSVLVYQGAITFLAGTARSFLTPTVITELTAVGGALIIGLSFNILGMARIKVANLLPALLVPLLLSFYFLG